MTPIRIVVVDDSVVIRRVLTDILNADPEIDVVATASNGRLGLERIAQYQPDLVTLDIEMPEMDGLAAVKELRTTDRRTPVIMFSTLTERGGSATLEALSNGANDYVTKPGNTGSPTAAMERVRTDLLPRIKALVGRGASVPRTAAGSTATPVAPVVTRPPRAATSPIEIVAIGTSTGGPNALEEVLTQLPGDLGVPIVIVQHMPPLFSRLLAERLDTKTSLRIVEAEPGMRLEPGLVVIAPGDYHMVLRQTLAGGVEVLTNQNPPENSCRPAVDVLFRSVAQIYGPRSFGVVMTGMGQDGMLGARALVDAGAEVIAQDEATSVVWGMPGAVAREGLATALVPLPQIASTIDRRVRRLSHAPTPVTTGTSR
jgi:two-component system chemotaxis response regulator CheB